MVVLAARVGFSPAFGRIYHGVYSGGNGGIGTH